jgi:hypothetical protein
MRYLAGRLGPINSHPADAIATAIESASVELLDTVVTLLDASPGMFCRAFCVRELRLSLEMLEYAHAKGLLDIADFDWSSYAVKRGDVALVTWLAQKHLLRGTHTYYVRQAIMSGIAPADLFGMAKHGITIPLPEAYCWALDSGAHPDMLVELLAAYPADRAMLKEMMSSAIYNGQFGAARYLHEKYNVPWLRIERSKCDDRDFLLYYLATDGPL